MAKVAVITRTKDRPVFLRRCISDVAKQSFTDYTHVIVNDGGDITEIEKIIDALADNVQKRIEVFHRKVSSNAPDTIFNESIDRGDSDYVVIHDDDDTWHEDFLDKCVAVLDSGAHGVVTRTDNVYEKQSGSNFKVTKISPYMSDLRAVSLYRQCLDNQLTTISFVYRRSAYEKVGKYDKTLPVVADWEFGIRFLREFDVEYIDPGYALAFYHRRLTGDNSFAAHNHRKYITKVFNKYLREDLESGKLGVGYIMNDLRYEQDMIASNIKKLMPTKLVNILRRKVR